MSRIKFPRSVGLSNAPQGENRRQRSFRIAGLFALGLCLTVGLHGNFSFCGQDQGLPSAVLVEKVIDGDTAVLKGGVTIRYLGINAPELRFREGAQWVLRPQVFAEEATEANRKLVEGKQVSLEYDTTTQDRYGRLLAYLRVGKVFVNQELISKGLAFADVRSPNGRYREVLLNAQREAQEAGRGLWGKASEPIPAQEAIHYVGRIKWVKGKVMRVRLGRTRISLCFGNDSRQDFAAIIYRDSLADFPFPKGDLGTWLKGKEVRVFGPIRKEGGPAIILGAPSQLEVRPSP
jgi:micrococcal nuclease